MLKKIFNFFYFFNLRKKIKESICKSIEDIECNIRIDLDCKFVFIEICTAGMFTNTIVFDNVRKTVTNIEKNMKQFAPYTEFSVFGSYKLRSK